MAIRLRNSIFIHIPKTGGSWVSNVLTHSGLSVAYTSNQHAVLKDIHGDARYADWSELPSFAFVRHPLTWWQSFWAFKRVTGWDYRNQIEVNCQNDDFGKFIQCVLKKYPGYITAAFKHYTTGVTCVGKMENLRADLKSFLRHFGERVNEPLLDSCGPVNLASNISDWQNKCIYPKDLRDEMLQSEREAVEMWGYTDTPPEIQWSSPH